jgi:hypothetical protein
VYTDTFLPQVVYKGKGKAVAGSVDDEAPNSSLGMVAQSTSSKSTVTPPSNSSAPNAEIRNQNTPDNDQRSTAGLNDELERLLKVTFVL